MQGSGKDTVKAQNLTWWVSIAAPLPVCCSFPAPGKKIVGHLTGNTSLLAFQPS